MRVHVLDEARLLYVEVPKAACSSVKRWMAAFQGWGEGPERNDDFHRWYGEPHYAQDVDEFDAWRKERWPDYFVFTVVRNPYRRFESLFYQRVYNERGETSISRFALRFPHDYWAGDDHGRPQAQLIGRNLSRYDYVGHVEDMEALGRMLTALTDTRVTIGHYNRGELGPRLQGLARSFVYAYFEEDFKLLGYEP